MSLMKKMARIIKEDMKKKAEREIEESSASMVDDYPKAAAYKPEQDQVWKKLYDNLYYISVYMHEEIADIIKNSVHNFNEKYQIVNDPSSTYGSLNRWVTNASEFLKGELNYKKEDLDKYTQEILDNWSVHQEAAGPLMKWEELNSLINQIDWSNPQQ